MFVSTHACADILYNSCDACAHPRTVAVTASQRNSKAESESMALELQQMRSRLLKAKKEAYRLEKTLTKSNTRTEAKALDGRTAPPSPAPGTLLGDWVAEERPRVAGGERTWSLSCKSSKGNSVGKAESKRSAPTGVSVAATTTGQGPRPGRHFSFFSEGCFPREE